MRINSALVSRRPLNSNFGAPPRIWTLLDGLRRVAGMYLEPLSAAGDGIVSAHWNS